MTVTLNTTIAARATSLQAAARAVIRVSGPDAIDAVETLFYADESADWRKRGVFRGTMRVASTRVRACVWVTRGPASYTGQDVVEIHLPGSWPIVRAIEAQLHQAGVRAALPGEFTARAVMLGKLALTQAESIDALIRAENDAQIDAALGMMGGAMDRSLAAAYDELISLVTAIETNIDFSEEDIIALPLCALKDRIDAVATKLTAVYDRAVQAETLARVPEVFLVGAANAGKSSLLNRLTGVDRAICSPLAGTTRDIVHAPWTHGDRQAMLADTAGLLDDQSQQDEITRQAVARVVAFAQSAEVVVVVIDATQDIASQVTLLDGLAELRSRFAVVVNKVDAVDAMTQQRVVDEVQKRWAMSAMGVSARTGEGLEVLSQCVFARLSEGGSRVRCGQLALNLRQREALSAACEALTTASHDAEMLSRGESHFGYEIVGSTVQHALGALASLLGKDATENVLDTVFSTFCIGK